MGVSPVNVYPPVTVTAVSDGGATETTVLVSNPINTDTVQKNVTICGFINISPGTSGVAVVLKVRRTGAKTGAQVGTTVTSIAVATDAITIPFAVVDQPGESAGIVYNVTVTETSAGADGTVNVGTIYAIVSQ